MNSALILAIVLSVLLIVGGAAIILSDARTRRVAIAGRILLIGAAAPAIVATPLPSAALMRAPEGKANRSEQREIQRLCGRLGIPARLAPAAYSWLRLGAAAILALAGVVAASLLLGRLPVQIKVMAGAVTGILGWLAPSFVVRHFTKQHSAAAAAGLSEALELLVVCVGAGLSLEDAIDRITGELKWSRPALAEELELTSADLKILPDRDLALANLAERLDVPSVRSVVTSLSQTLRYGTPLGQALRATAAELRNDGLLRMEERANRLPTLLTLPMMLFIMPTIFLVIGGPAVLKVMDLFAHRR